MKCAFINKSTVSFTCPSDVISIIGGAGLCQEHLNELLLDLRKNQAKKVIQQMTKQKAFSWGNRPDIYNKNDHKNYLRDVSNIR